MGKSFRYKDFVNKLRFQIGGVCPEEFGEYGEKYIRGIVYSQALKAAEALREESSVSDEACEVITQTIAEWSFHKIIDLLNGEIPEVFHERILKKVNGAIYDFLIDENRQRVLTYETFQEPDVKDVLDMLIKDTYRDALAQLYSDKGICKDVYKYALTQSHIDDNYDDDEEDSDYSKKEDTFVSNSQHKMPYLEIFLKSPFIFAFYALEFVIIMAGIVLLEFDIYLVCLIIYLVILIFRIARRVTLNYYSISHSSITELEEQIEDLNEAANPNSMYQRLGVDVISLQIGFGLIPLVDPEQRNKLLPAVAKLRKDLTDELGYIIPNIRVMDSSKLKANECRICIRGNQRVAFFVDTKAHNKEEIIINEIRKACIKYVNEIFTKTDVLKLMELVRSQDPTLVNDLIPDLISAIDFRRIMVNLIREEVSIKDIILIFERLCDFARFNNQPQILTERIRSEMGAMICLSHTVEKDNDNVLYCLTLSQKWEKLLEDKVTHTELGTMFMLTPVQITKFIEAVANTLLKLKNNKENVVLLVSPKIRLPLFGLLVRHFEDIKVLSFSELVTEIKVESLGEVK